MSKLLDDSGRIWVPCLWCGERREFAENSSEAQGVFNVFCHDKDCEDRYAWREMFGLGEKGGE